MTPPFRGRFYLGGRSTVVWYRPSAVARRGRDGYLEIMKSILPIVFLCCVPALVSAEIYRSVDENGNVVYTDQPGQDAKKVDLPELSTYESKPVPAGTFDAEAQPAAANAVQLSFVQPGADETIFDNEGNVAVAVRVDPPLQAGQRMALQLDEGSPVETDQPTYQFSGVDRGTHTLHAWVLGADGTQQGERVSVTFHLRQASRLFRNQAPPNSSIQQAPRAPAAPNVPSGNNNS